MDTGVHTQRMQTLPVNVFLCQEGLYPLLALQVVSILHGSELRLSHELWHQILGPKS